MTDNEKKPILPKPPWLKVRAGRDDRYRQVQSLLKEQHLHTVCQEANCPNRGECFSSGTATFLILGPTCTRNCRFCNVTHGAAAPVDTNEPAHVARTVEILQLRHAVITSVTRDDLPDGGAAQFAAVINAIRALERKVSVEVLTPDFKGNRESLGTVFEADPDIFNHNVETVPRLYPAVRPQADYERSMNVLRFASESGRMAVKSGLMVGLGETIDELENLFFDLYQAGVEYLTIGQYLAPSQNHYPIAKFYHPDEFLDLGRRAEKIGIKYVFSAPLVRSSYHAGEQFHSQ